MRLNSNLTRAAILTGLLLALTGVATPTQIYQKNQTGNFVLFGNTMGTDCHFDAGTFPTPQPVVGTVGDCGTKSASISAPAVFWRADDPDAGTAFADTSITVDQARTTSVLVLPSGVGVTYARLFWGAHSSASDFGKSITLERPGTFSEVLTADDGESALYADSDYLYQSSVDVTALVQQYGSGAYRVGNFASDDFVTTLNSDYSSAIYAAWTMVVFYASDNEPTRQLTLFKSLDQIRGAGSSVTSTITGFQVPSTSNSATLLGVVAYEGDWSLQGDRFLFNGTAVSHGNGTDTNFFDGSRTDTSLQGTVSHVGDLPQLTGGPGSNTGIDVHTTDVSLYVHPGDTSATVQATSSSDFYVLGIFVTAISTLKPVFVDTFKHYVDVNGGDIRKGDVIEYTVSTVNTGSDTGQNVTLTDVLPPQVTYMPGTLQIVSTNAGGAPVGPLTDDVGDDTGQFDASSNTVTVWLGTGAASGTGGTIDTTLGAPVGTPPLGVTIKFDVVLNSTDGEVINQAQVSTTSTNSGGNTATFLSDMTDTGAGVPTSFGIDECSVDSDCTTSAKPLCDTAANPNRCVQCLSSSSCTGALPVCDTTSGLCVGCTSDAECTDPALPRCDMVKHDCTIPLPVASNTPHFEGGGCGGCSGSGGPLSLGLLALSALFLMGRGRKAVR